MPHSGVRLSLIVLGLGLAGAGIEVQAAPPAVGEKAKDFTLARIDGQAIRLQEINRQGPVVLVVLRGYPGYQCPICTRQVADLVHHAKELGVSRAQVVLIYPGPSENLAERAKEFLKGATLPESFTFVIDPGYQFTNAYQLRWNARNETAYPSTFVIDEDGMVTFAKISKSHGDRASATEILKALSASASR